MPTVKSWHSTRPSDPAVYHNNSTCEDGNNIETRYRQDGTGNRRICDRCDRYNREGK